MRKAFHEKTGRLTDQTLPTTDLIASAHCDLMPVSALSLVVRAFTMRLLSGGRTFQARIADGTIHSGLERRAAVEMIESYFSSLPKRGTR